MSGTEGFLRKDMVGEPVKMPGGQLELKPPPELSKPVPPKLMQIVLPAFIVVMVVGMVVMMISMGGGLGSGRMPYMVMMMPMFLIMALMGMTGQSLAGGTGGTDINEDRKDFLRYLGKTRKRIQKVSSDQLAVRQWWNPDPATLISFVGSPRMWERRPEKPHFVEVRVGRGTERLAMKLEPPKGAPVDYLEPLTARGLRRLVDTYKAVSGVPVAIALRTYPHISLTDESGDGVAEALMRAMLSQLVLLHGPDDLLVVIVSGDPDGAGWEWVKWLPHNQHPTLTDSLGSARMVYPDVPTARAALSSILRTRGTHSRDSTTANPHVVIVCDQVAGLTSAHTLLGSDGIDAVTLIELSSAWLGAEDDTTAYRMLLRDGLLHVPDNHGNPIQFAVPDQIPVAAAADLARAISRFRPASEMDIIEQRVTRKVNRGGLFGQWGITDVAAIDPDVMQRPGDMRDFMKVPIGVTPAGEPVLLDLKESAQFGIGPHGIMVGATGSGKSEHLRSLVIALAAKHSSERLNMLLIDYKGGAAFLGFDELPHVSAILTNMEAEHHLVERMDIAIRGEINRRQEIFRAAALRDDVHTQIPNIHIYNEVRASGVPLEPLPVLFIVVDEFAELLQQHPEFTKLFALIGQQGRSMGINLLLSSQRLQAGRIADVEAHLSYRIALRTFTPAESRDILGATDAVDLPDTPGSAYLKMPSGELVRYRAFFTGGAYTPPKRSAPVVVEAEVVPDHPRPQLFTASSPSVLEVMAEPAAPVGMGETPVDEEAVAAELPAAAGAVSDAQPHAAKHAVGVNVNTDAMVAIGRMAGRGPAAHRIWLPPLDYSHTLYALYHDPDLYWPIERGFLQIPIGMIDTPYYQRRDALIVDLMGANLAVVGSSKSGVSTLLQSLIVSAAMTHSSRELQFYCLDFSAGKLVALKDLAHVGSVATQNRVELASRTVAEMTAIWRRRIQLFVDADVTSMNDFRRRKAQNDPTLASDRNGDVVLVIDGWTTITRDEDSQLANLESAITTLAEKGKSYGVHVVIASSRHADFKPALKDNLGGRLELRLNDPTVTEVGNKRTAERVPKLPGRGIAKSTRPRTSQDVFTVEVLDYLVALPIAVAGYTPVPLSTELEVEVRTTIEHINGTNPVRAVPIRLLPSVLPRHEFMADLPRSAPPAAGRADLTVPIGQGETDMAAKAVDFNELSQTHLYALGDRQSGKTALLRHVVTTLFEKNSADQVQFMMVDYQRRLLGLLPDGYGQYVTSESEVKAFAAIMAERLQSRIPGKDLTPRQRKERSWWSGPDVFVIVDDADEVAARNAIDPLEPLRSLLSRGHDIGLHMVVAQPVNGASRYLFSSTHLAVLKKLNSPALVMSGLKDEGVLVGTIKPQQRPPGRGILVTRDGEELVHVPYVPGLDDDDV